MKDTSASIKLLTTGEAGALVGVSARTVQNWAKADRIPYLELPSGEYRIPLNGFLASMGGTFDLGAELVKLEELTGGIDEAQVTEALRARRGSA